MKRLMPALQSHSNAIPFVSLASLAVHTRPAAKIIRHAILNFPANHLRAPYSASCSATHMPAFDCSLTRKVGRVCYIVHCCSGCHHPYDKDCLRALTEYLQPDSMDPSCVTKVAKKKLHSHTFFCRTFQPC